MRTDPSMSMGQCATTACLLEVTAPKPGNVHRGADFEDVTFLDFALSAVAIGPIFDQASNLSVGQLILQAIEATRRVVNTNTNLGLMLLMAPLAKIDAAEGFEQGITRVLSKLTSQDSADVYQAIGIAKPGGMGKVAQHDVAAAPPSSLLEAMALAAERDLIAKQYAGNFAELKAVVNQLLAVYLSARSLMAAIVNAHVWQMGEHPDSLIARKCGVAISTQSAAFASRVLESGVPGEEAYENAISDLDFWLRSDGHKRNPGTTADLIGAALFWLLRTGKLSPPFST